MDYGMYVSAAGAMANSYRLDVVANNLANADTIAFKRDLAMLETRPTQVGRNGGKRYTTALLEKLGGGLFALPTYTDFKPGSLQQTGGSYDVALAGKGFFRVQKDDQVYFTRDGRFMLDESKKLVTLDDGYPVLDHKGKPIELDPAYEVHIDQDGMISQQGEEVTRLGVVDIKDTDGLIKEGNNKFRAEGEVATQPLTARVKQGYLEESGVEPVTELTQMIRTQRMLENNLNLLRMQNQTMSAAVTRLGMITG